MTDHVAAATESELPELGPVDRERRVALIAAAPVGRLAVIGPNGAPHVVPVNFVVDMERIYFCSDDGVKLTAPRSQIVTFQVDHVDVFRRVGWSVMVHGRAHEAAELPRSVSGWTRAGQHI